MPSFSSSSSSDSETSSSEELSTELSNLSHGPLRRPKKLRRPEKVSPHPSLESHVSSDPGLENLLEDLIMDYSTITERDLFPLLRKYHLILDEYWYSEPRGLKAHQAPHGCITVYEQALVAGLRFPLAAPIVEVFSVVGLCPSQLSPNGWRCLSTFVLCCRARDIEPTA